MPRISEIWRTRFLLIGLILLSLVPVLLHRILSASQIYEIRFRGGLHPLDLLTLRRISQLSFVFPAIFICALIGSTVRPDLALARLLLTISVALFLVYVIGFLWWAIIVIELHVPV